MLQLANNLSVARGTPHAGIVILTGRTGSGKTTLAGLVTEELHARGVRVAGILARGLLAGSRRSGFDLVDLSTGRSMPLCRVGEPGGPGHQRCGPFEFTRAGLEFGGSALAVDAGRADVVVIDEVGPLELSGGGWADALDSLTVHFDGALLIVARLAVVDAVRTRWGTPDTPVRDASRSDASTLCALLEVRVGRNTNAHRPSQHQPAPNG
jgi:nucleoside-triphosphatase THEP1